MLCTRRLNFRPKTILSFHTLCATPLAGFGSCIIAVPHLQMKTPSELTPYVYTTTRRLRKLLHRCASVFLNFSFALYAPPLTGFDSCIIAVPRLDPVSVMREVMPLLQPSTPFVVYSQWVQPLADCLHYLLVSVCVSVSSAD